MPMTSAVQSVPSVDFGMFIDCNRTGMTAGNYSRWVAALFAGQAVSVGCTACSYAEVNHVLLQGVEAVPCILLRATYC